MGEADREPGNPTETPNRTKRKASRLARWLIWIGAIVLVLAIAAGIAIAVLMRRAEPMLRAGLIDTLQQRFHARVELDDLHVSIVDGFQAEGRGLRIWLPVEAQQNLVTGAENVAPAQVEEWKTQPWIVVGSIRFHGTWRIRPGEPVVIPVVYVEGVRVLLPPKADRPRISLSGAQPADITRPQPVPGMDSGAGSGPASSLLKMAKIQVPQVIVQRIECRNPELVIERKQDPDRPPRIPLDFQFNRATVIPDSKGGPMAFSVDMVNAKPVGDIHTTGHAGPWTPSDPGALPVEGDYKFQNADLSTIKGIAGTLSSTGHYEGTLRAIEADGDTQTPDFRLERVEQGGESLTTHFHALIDGTNGDTRLEPVDAMLGHTHIVARGAVLRFADPASPRRGHDIVLEVAIDRGRIEDILHISSNSEAAFLTGSLVMQTHFHLPPGPESVLDKLQLDGQFHLAQARFSSDKMQGRITELSLRGQGKPHEVKDTDPSSVLSEMHGHFKLGGGMLRLPDIEYRVPGAQILAHGAYGMQSGSLSFDGDAKLDATLSEIVGGWKGLLLKPADRFLQKNGAGTDVPIRVEGTRKDPKFGVDFGRLGKTDKPPQ